MMLDILKCCHEEIFHNNTCILHLGEVSEKLFFVLSGEVAVFVDIENTYCPNIQASGQAEKN